MKYLNISKRLKTKYKYREFEKFAKEKEILLKNNRLLQNYMPNSLDFKKSLIILITHFFIGGLNYGFRED